MTKDEALRLALEALIEVRDANIRGLTLTQHYHEAITAIKAALEAPQRTWVGLTDEEQIEMYRKHSMDGWSVFYDAIEAKLKEKNNG